MDKRKGFTLIELVIVIIILGILAAFIVPRFTTLSKEARISTVKAVQGSLRSASTIVHALAVAQGKNLATGQTVKMEDGTEVDLAYGWPAGTATGIGSALTDYANAFSATFVGGVATFKKIGAPTPDNCSVTYSAATSTAVPPSIQDPISDAGC